MKRRELLQYLSALSTGIYPGLTSAGSASASVPPKRFVVFYTHQGAVTDTWQLASSSQALSPTLLSDATTLYPLTDWSDRIAVIDGIALVSGELDGNAIGFRHETAASQILTGTQSQLLGGIPLGTRTSLDQMIANTIALPSQFSSLEWGVGSPFNAPFYLDNTLPLLPNCLPHLALRQLTGDGFGIAPKWQQDNFQHFDVQFSEIQSGLSAEDRAKMAQHRTLLAKLSSRNEGISALQTQCDVGNASVGFPTTTQEYDVDFSSFLHLLDIAFTCDLSRVITLNMGQIPMNYLRGDFGDVHVELAHNIHTDANAKTLMTDYSILHASHFAELLQTLDSKVDPLGQGESLLDNTLVLWISNLGDGTHCYNNLPVILAGGESFSDFKMGRYHHLTETSPVLHWDGLGFSEEMGVPHQRLLNSIAMQFDLGMSEFDRVLRNLNGEPLKSSGIIEELHQ